MIKKKQKQLDRADKKNDKDYELFLQDLEDSPELRANVNLYKVSLIIFFILKYSMNCSTGRGRHCPTWSEDSRYVSQWVTIGTFKASSIFKGR